MEVHHPAVAFFCTPEFGHFQPLRPLISRLAADGISAFVFTHRDFQHQVQRAGGIFVDLFGTYRLDEADNQSQPIPCRYVSFAGHFADRIIEDLGDLNPSCIISETFSVIGPVVAKALGLPHINVCVGHDMNPTRFMAALVADQRVAISQQCFRAVDRLRDDFHLPDASPFSYVSQLSPLLNIYGEPPQFLDQQARASFEPLAFFGCLPDHSSLPENAAPRCSYFANAPPNTLRVYVSFGTVIWRYFANEAAVALTAISRAFADMNQLRAVISLGGAAVDRRWAGSLANANVQVIPYVDQPAILEQTDLFITHHGINSTHEAIYKRVPMISYPFFSDQPALAQRCQDLGLAIPLTASLQAPPKHSEVKTAVARFLASRSRFQSNLNTAHAWEQHTLDQRALVMQQIKHLMLPLAHTAR